MTTKLPAPSRPSRRNFIDVYVLVRIPHAEELQAGPPPAMAAWNGWFDSMGANLVDQGKPVFERSVLGSCAADTVLGGYSMVRADDLEAAVAIAKGCPALQEGGGVEVGELGSLESVTRSIAADASPAHAGS